MLRQNKNALFTFVDDVKIDVTVLRHISGPKVRVYKMRPKKKTRKKQGHRQQLTRVLINKIDIQ